MREQQEEEENQKHIPNTLAGIKPKGEEWYAMMYGRL